MTPKRDTLKSTESSRQRPVVLTLTSIPPRFSNLGRKFRSIEKQTLKPDHVELNIPRNYRRFPGEVPSLPDLPDWVSVESCPVDYGPATKVLPTVERWRSQAVDLLICDDDRLPDKHWIERLLRARRTRADDILTERGWHIDDRFSFDREKTDLPRCELDPRGGRSLAYRLKRGLSLGAWHPPRQVVKTPGYVDVFEGFLGVLAPNWSWTEKVFDIPEAIWTVDDVWLSGMAYLNGTKVWAHDIPRPVYADSHFDKVEPLKRFVHGGYGRNDADYLAVEYLRENEGVWV